MRSKKKTNAINRLTAFFGLMALLCGVTAVHAEESSELEYMANLLILADSSEPFMEAGDKAKGKNDYMGALAYYAAASTKFPDEHYPTYQTAAVLAYMENGELAEDYLQEADKRGLWESLLMEDDSELDFIRDTKTLKPF